MTDQPIPAPETPVETAPGTPPVGIGLVTDGAYFLVAGQFATLEQAQAAYATREQIESSTSLRIDAVIMASADAKGDIKLHQATDHATKTGLKWGVVGGVVLGVIFPPTIIAGAVGMGVVGTALGKIRNIGHRSQVSDALQGAIDPGMSGLLVLAQDTRSWRSRRRSRRRTASSRPRWTSRSRWRSTARPRLPRRRWPRADPGAGDPARIERTDRCCLTARSAIQRGGPSAFPDPYADGWTTGNTRGSGGTPMGDSSPAMARNRATAAGRSQ